MTKVYGKNMSVREFFEDTYRPRSESRPDLVERDELMRTHIAIRRQRAREKQFVLVLVGMVVAAMVGLSLYHNLYEIHHQDALERVFN